MTNRRFFVAGLFACAALGVMAWVTIRSAGVDPDELLKMEDLKQTSVTYSRSGYFTIEGGVTSVTAVFNGDGTALLRLNSENTIRVKISPDRYRTLLRSMADNGFSTVGVRRRWCTYLADFGRLDIAVQNAGRKTFIRVDAKHYVNEPERLEAILDTIYSFEKEFGESLSYGPLAVSTHSDYRDLVLPIACVAVVVLILGGSAALRRCRRRRSPLEP